MISINQDHTFQVEAYQEFAMFTNNLGKNIQTPYFNNLVLRPTQNYCFGNPQKLV